MWTGTAATAALTSTWPTPFPLSLSLSLSLSLTHPKNVERPQSTYLSHSLSMACHIESIEQEAASMK